MLLFFKRSLFGYDPAQVEKKISEMQENHVIKCNEIENELVQVISQVEDLKRQLSESESLLNSWLKKRDALINLLFSNHMQISTDLFKEVKNAGEENPTKALQKLRRVPNQKN